MRVKMTSSEFRALMSGFGAVLLALGFCVCAIEAFTAFVPNPDANASARDSIFQGLTLIGLGGGLRILTRIERHLAQGPRS